MEILLFAGVNHSINNIKWRNGRYSENSEISWRLKDVNQAIENKAKE